MSFDVACQILTRDPFSLSFAEIADLTDYQINEILLKPRRGEEGAESDDGRELQSLTPEELFWKVWARRGLSEAEIEEKWVAEQAGGTGTTD